MEDWQEWQIRADQVAADLGRDVDALERDFFTDESATNFRAFWPRFRDLKERVRIAPAIKLDDKLSLERRLRGLGSRAYKGQEVAFAQSSEQKAEILPRIDTLRAAAEGTTSPRDLRGLRRELDSLRREFDADKTLVAADRQALWDAWRAANQLVWDRLTGSWSENERTLQAILTTARQDLERGNANAARQNVRRFFESLRTNEAKQEAVNRLKAEAEEIRRDAEEAEERRQTARAAASTPHIPTGSPVDGWRSELDRNREALGRLVREVSELEAQFESSESVLAQAMIRGNLVDKRRKVTELERANRALEQRIEQTEEAPLIPSA
jgi:DNA repair exonuclease SbcCD ATPase subunit